jgi:hypothetical protein
MTTQIEEKLILFPVALAGGLKPLEHYKTEKEEEIRG